MTIPQAIKNWVSVRLLLSVLFCFAGFPEGGYSQQNKQEVEITVTVTDKNGRAMSGLKQSDFTVFEGQVAQEIVSFSNRDQPISVGLILDASRSIFDERSGSNKRKVQILNEGLKRFLQTSNESNEYFLAVFGTTPRLLLDWTSDHDLLEQKLLSVERQGNTTLYDACYLGIQKVLQGRYQKRVIILVSDGQDNNSRVTFREVREMLRESNVLFYSLGVFGESAIDLREAGKGIIEELSSVSGGKSFSPSAESLLKTSDVNALFENLANELRNQYTITIAIPNSVADKKLHKIKVRLSSKPSAPGEVKHLSVRSREGFYRR